MEVLLVFAVILFGIYLAFMAAWWALATAWRLGVHIVVAVVGLCWTLMDFASELAARMAAAVWSFGPSDVGRGLAVLSGKALLHRRLREVEATYAAQVGGPDVAPTWCAPLFDEVAVAPEGPWDGQVPPALVLGGGLVLPAVVVGVLWGGSALSDALDERVCESARQQESLVEWERYILDRPDGPCVDEAQAAVELLSCGDARAANTSQSWTRYLQRFPEGGCAAEAVRYLERPLVPAPTPTRDAASLQPAALAPTPRATPVPIPRVMPQRTLTPTPRSGSTPTPEPPSGLSLPAWIILAGAYNTESEAAERARSLRGAGWDADYLWIPDYGSLSGARMFAAFVGPVPHSRTEDAQRLLRELSREASGTYGLKLALSGPRVELSAGRKPSAPSISSVVPSYSCGSARTESEIAVCRSSHLARLDSQMADLYSRKQSGLSVSANDRLASAQRTWLGNRERCSRRIDMDECMKRLYRARIGELGR